MSTPTDHEPGHDPGDELVDVVDASGAVTGQATRRQVRAGRLRHRCVFVVVDDGAGRVLVHRRSPTKDLWPDRWDLAVGGLVAAGEGWEAAARRELAEEVGVRPAPGALEDLGAGVFRDDDCDLVARVFRCVHPGPFTFTDGEVVEVAFVERAELAVWTTRVLVVPDSVEVVLPRLT